jgi:hypothetical protein
LDSDLDSDSDNKKETKQKPYFFEGKKKKQVKYPKEWLEAPGIKLYCVDDDEGPRFKGLHRHHDNEIRRETEFIFVAHENTNKSRRNEIV